MAGKKYYWLKLKEDFFTQKEIKRLRRLAGGDTYTIIYLKLLLISLKNEGKIFFDDVGDNLIDELSIEIDENADDVKVTISYLQQKGLLELVKEDEIYLNEVKTMIGSESDSAERVRRYRRNLRNNIKSLQSNDLQLNSNAKMLQRNIDVTKSNIEIDIEKEIEKEINNKDICPDKYPLTLINDNDKNNEEQISFKDIYNYYLTLDLINHRCYKP